MTDEHRICIKFFSKKNKEGGKWKFFASSNNQSNNSLESLRKIVQNGQEILVIDFSDLKEEEMITLISDSRKLLITEQRPQKLLATFNSKNYITTKVMRHFETDQVEAINYSEKLATVGLSTTQKLILKGYNVIFNRDIKAFDNQEDAIRYLTGEK